MLEPENDLCLNTHNVGKGGEVDHDPLDSETLPSQ